MAIDKFIKILLQLNAKGDEDIVHWECEVVDSKSVNMSLTMSTIILV